MASTELMRQWYLDRLGVMLWREKHILQETQEAPMDAAQKLAALQKCVAVCQNCNLHTTRTQTVFGVGSPSADLMIIGEAPGANEDRLGQPFVGRAGQLLDAMLRAIGLDRQKVYIGNIIKCRPPQNRDPLPLEVETCTPFLTQQIGLIAPKLILALGRVSAHFLLQSHLSLTKLRGTLHQYGALQTPLIVTFHPAYLLRSPLEKEKALTDLLWVKDLLKTL